jgi:chromosome segregation ATPase
LQEEKTQLTEEVDTHLEALEVSEDWHKRQKQELLDKIKELETKVSQLSEENKQLKEQSKIESYEQEIEELKVQLAKITSQQQAARVEVPAKNGGIKGFFKFIGKK